MKSVRETYEGSDGDATKELYARLETLGAIGVVALNLFRACKASERAKKYTRRYKGTAYEKKNWSLKLLCDALDKVGPQHSSTCNSGLAKYPHGLVAGFLLVFAYSYYATA